LWIDAPSRWRWCGCELSKAWYFHGVFGCNCLLVSCDVVYCWVVMMYHCMHYWGRRKKERECIRWWVWTVSLRSYCQWISLHDLPIALFTIVCNALHSFRLYKQKKHCPTYDLHPMMTFESVLQIASVRSLSQCFFLS
jgi:hypothetical protein